MARACHTGRSLQSRPAWALTAAQPRRRPGLTAARTCTTGGVSRRRWPRPRRPRSIVGPARSSPPSRRSPTRARATRRSSSSACGVIGPASRYTAAVSGSRRRSPTMLVPPKSMTAVMLVPIDNMFPANASRWTNDPPEMSGGFVMSGRSRTSSAGSMSSKPGARARLAVTFASRYPFQVDARSGDDPCSSPNHGRR